MYRNRQLCGWSHFLKAVVHSFGTKSLEAPESLLAKLQMTISVSEYLSHSEKLANRTTEMSPSMLKHYFTSRIHPDIKADVLSSRPVDLNEAIGLAFL